MSNTSRVKVFIGMQIENHFCLYIFGQGLFLSLLILIKLATEI